MVDEIDIKVPDIGGAKDVEVIEIMVKEGDEISIDTPLITLESDKASMEIPSSSAGKISAIKIKKGDKVSEGDLILVLTVKKPKTFVKDTDKEEKSQIAAEPSQNTSELVERTVSELTVSVPDIGGATNVDVIDILVKAGDQISKDQALITLEGDKATMDIPSPVAGKVKVILIKVGDKVSRGNAILTLLAIDTTHHSATINSEKSSPEIESSAEKNVKTSTQSLTLASTNEYANDNGQAIHAGPAVRRMAREFELNLSQIKGSGAKSRITKDDVVEYIKQSLHNTSISSDNLTISKPPKIDFSKFGKIESKPLNKIKRLTGINVHRSWITIPHVTQFDEADITELEAFRKKEQENLKQSTTKLTLLAFVTRIVSQALIIFPQFNTSLDESGENLIYKQYINIGIAVETSQGLVVPVIKEVDKRSVIGIADEMARLSILAREKGLMPADMSGGCFTISSLGGIGGTAFTPIVNSPEVAILGLSRAAIKPSYINNEFVPRLMLPLSLSYDHRVIDGAEAARFTRYIADMLSDLRRFLL